MKQNFGGENLPNLVNKFSYHPVISQAQVGYHCYYMKLRVKPEVEC